MRVRSSKRLWGYLKDENGLEYEAMVDLRRLDAPVEPPEPEPDPEPEPEEPDYKYHDRAFTMLGR